MLKIIPRSEWGARPPKHRTLLADTDAGFFWHWLGPPYPTSMSDEQILQSVQRYHMDTKGWSDIAYSFAVGRDAGAYELRGWGVAGGHTKGYNHNSYAIVFLIGAGEKPTPEMFRTAWAIMAEKPEIERVRPHRAVSQTTCPGDEIALEVTNQIYKGQPMAMTPTSAEAAVRRAYDKILNRKADAGGLKYWTDRLVAGSVDLEDVRWFFLETRLAADAAAQAAVFANTIPGADAKAAEQAYRLFLDNLIALNEA